MIDHIGFPVSDYQRSKAFYLKALAPLDYSLVMEMTQEQQPGASPAAGFGAKGKPDFWIGGEGGLNKPLHVAIVAKDRLTVDASTRRRSQRADATMARRESARIITPIITAPSCSTPTATTSKPCATSRSDLIAVFGSICGQGNRTGNIAAAAPLLIAAKPRPRRRSAFLARHPQGTQ
jgi:catechol 2,3-dioxygenase-like lactoylglutathione lyase family enzyme